MLVDSWVYWVGAGLNGFGLDSELDGIEFRLKVIKLSLRYPTNLPPLLSYIAFSIQTNVVKQAHTISLAE